jgi:hypothetical protein
VLYSSDCTGGAMPGLVTKYRPVTPAHHFLETALRPEARLLHSPYIASQNKTIINTTEATWATTPLHQAKCAAGNVSFHSTPATFGPSNPAPMLAPLVDNGLTGHALLQAAANATALRSAISASPRSRAVGGGAFFASSD